jgi:hypothetical protein
MGYMTEPLDNDGAQAVEQVSNVALGVGPVAGSGACAGWICIASELI